MAVTTGAIVQFAPEFGAVSKNLDAIETAIQQACASNPEDRPGLWVLPELCLTGYQFRDKRELSELAEPIDGTSTKRLVAVAREAQAFLVAGVAEAAGRGFYNSAVLVGPKGLLGVYRKVHLFGRERDLFLPGDMGFPTFSLPFGRIGMMVCFDWLFPEAARSLALDGALVVAHPANLVLPYCQAAVVTRCLENRIFILTANRTGRESRLPGEALTFTGRSRIVAPDGRILAEGPKGGSDSEITVLRASLDLDLARDKWITPRNHVLADRRPSQYRFDQVRGEDQ